MFDALDGAVFLAARVRDRAADEIVVEVLAGVQHDRIARGEEHCAGVFARGVGILDAFDAQQEPTSVGPDCGNVNRRRFRIALAAQVRAR